MEETTEKIMLPKEVQVVIEGREIRAKGPGGEVARKIDDPQVEAKVEDSRIIITCKGTSKREKRKIGTWVSHIKNMCKGAAEPCIYRLKICSGHFPMTATTTDKEFTVKNFLGEKVPRKVKIKTGSKVRIEGDIVIVESPDKELAGQTAADIEKLCRIVNKDSRIFQDGIWIIEKDGKTIK
ncbi:MAG: 50S ribosomal protein L6 [Candidatus Woesearchaeota archaeon]